MGLQIKGIDVVAAVCIVCLSILVYSGHNSAIVSLIATIVGYYFGRKSRGEK